jgi:HPt (histidine-containing phosphotransfer) domain-containing protein
MPTHATQPATVPELPPLDAETLAGLRALDPEGGDSVVREITAIFLEDAPGRIRELESAAARGDVERFVREAHSLKGGAASLGASLVRHASERIESSTRREGLSTGIALLPELQAAWRESEPHLRRLLG